MSRAWHERGTVPTVERLRSLDHGSLLQLGSLLGVGLRAGASKGEVVRSIHARCAWRQASRDGR